MAIKLLESLPSEGNDVLQQIDDGALMNFQAVHQQNGAIYGCLITNTSSTVSIGPGLLIVRGFRFKIESSTPIKNFAIGGYPEEVTTYYLYLKVTRTGNNATFTWESTRIARLPYTSQIERQEGSYGYKVAECKVGSSGIIGKVKSLIGTISASSGQGGDQGVSMALPDPRLEIVNTANSEEEGENEGMTRGYLCIANMGDYSKFKDIYKIKFVLLRYLQRGRARHRSEDSKIYTLRTGFVKPYKHVGWQEGESTLKISLDYDELQEVVIAQEDAYQYKRSSVIDSVYNIVDNTFYYWNPITEEKESIEPFSDQEVGYIRSTRTRSLGRQKPLVRKHNFFKFCYQAELYDSAGNLVAVSNPGSTVTILLNRALMGGSENATMDGLGLGEVFKIKIE